MSSLAVGVLGGTGAAILGAGIVGGGISAYGASKAGKSAEKGAAISAAAQTEELNYLKEINALPQQLKEEALTKLAGGYGLEGGEGSMQDIIDQAKASPLYSSIMSGQEAGEEAILRTGSATGMLRSGNTIDAIADDAEQRKNQALLTSFNQQMTGLQGMAQLPTNEARIGSTISGIGATTAQGQIASGQAYQQGLQGVTDSLGTGASNLLYAKGKGII